MSKFDPANVKALVFDVFGTVVDWRSSIIRQMEAFGREKGIGADWAAFTDDWRGGYQPAMDRVRKGEAPWTVLDDLHRQILETLLVKHKVTGLSEAEKERINTVWHRLDPWPDAVAGLSRLKRRFIIATMSNGNIALLLNMAKHSGLPWDAIWGAEPARKYKPDPETYLSAPRFLRVPPEQVMMVAAHNNDLVAAGQQGLRTAFVARPREYGIHQKHDFKAEHDFDVVATDFVELAGMMRA